MVDTNIAQKISTRLARRSYVSEEVRSHLQTLARLLTAEHNPTVEFADHSTAATKHDMDDLEIIITDDKIKQPVTNIEEDAWQLLAREALLIHEIGHVKYTDFEAYEEVFGGLGPKEKTVVHKIYNAAEDAAIDQQLRWKFNCSRELDTHLANLFSEGKDDAHRLGLLSAVHLAILEKGVYPVGTLDEYQNGERELVHPELEEDFDEILPMVDDMLADVMSESNAKKRYERIWEFWEDLKEYDAIWHTRNEDTVFEIPDDTTGMTPGEDADELEDVDPEDVGELVMEIGAPPEQDEDSEADESGEQTDENQEEDEQEGKGKPDEETEESDDLDLPGGGGGHGHGDGGGFGEHEDHNLVLVD